MNGKSRFLPRLNLCYLQKKAYEIHLKKMDTIQHRPRNVQKATSTSSLSNEKQFAPINENKMTVIRQRSERTVMKMSPYCKKLLQQTERQNLRLFNAIQKCPSTISRKTLSQHKFLNEQFKGRISKFAVLPGSKRTLLKCQISLSKIGQKGKQSRLLTFSNNSNSKNLSVMKRYAKTQQSQNKEPYRTLENTSINDPNQYSQNLLIRRNRNKVNSHFERSQITLRTKQKLQGFRQNVEQGKKMHANPIYKWKTRCFTTQIQSHSKQTQ